MLPAVVSPRAMWRPRSTFQLPCSLEDEVSDDPLTQTQRADLSVAGSPVGCLRMALVPRLERGSGCQRDDGILRMEEVWVEGEPGCPIWKSSLGDRLVCHVRGRSLGRETGYFGHWSTVKEIGSRRNGRNYPGHLAKREPCRTDYWELAEDRLNILNISRVSFRLAQTICFAG
jgi:hypothetical protein